MSISTFTGSLTVRERIAIPAGAVATIKLVAADGEVLAATAVETPGVPVDFELSVDTDILEATKKLRIWALLRTEVGAWGTLELAKLPGDGEPITLSRIPD